MPEAARPDTDTRNIGQDGPLLPPEFGGNSHDTAVGTARPDFSEREEESLEREAISVLHVEDSESDAALICRLLETGGFALDCKRVETAQELRAALGERAWDIIIADNHLPQFDAGSALKTLQSSGRDIPFVVVSGAVGEDVAVDLMKRGAHDFVMKSKLARLVPAVRREIKEARSRQERKQAEEALRRSEYQFRHLAESIPQLVWMTDAKGETIYSNIRFQHQLGAGSNAAPGTWAQAIHPEDRERCVTAWQESLITGTDFLRDGRLQLASGQYRWFKLHAIPVNDEGGKTIRWFGTCTDIDDQKQIQHKLLQANADLARSNATLEQFAYVASHDLQEPLRNIVLQLQLLSSQWKDKLGVEGNECIQFAVDGALRMRHLIKDLLAFSRAGRHDQAFAAVSMDDVVDEALVNLRAAMEESEGTVTRSALPILDGDSGQLVQLFQNLIGNALKYRKDGIPPVVSISTERQQNEWLFAVQDNGIGIDPIYFDRIFKIFKRLHGRDKYEGTGVGLAISQRIVECHKGRLWVESAEGAGSTFYFTIPCAIAENSFQARA